MPHLQTRKAANPRPRPDLVTRSLTLRADSIERDKRSFEAVVSTDGVVTVLDRRRWELIDEVLVRDGGQFPAHVPLLDAHFMYSCLSVVGSAVEFRKEGDDRWLGRGIIADAAHDRDPVEQIWLRVRDGHIRAVSIGYRPLEYTDIAAGKRQKVGGKFYTAGERTLRITSKWRVYELSITPVGADSEALIRQDETKDQGPTPATPRRRFR